MHYLSDVVTGFLLGVWSLMLYLFIMGPPHDRREGQPAVDRFAPPRSGFARTRIGHNVGGPRDHYSPASGVTTNPTNTNPTSEENTMSTDAKVTRDLIETLKDGERGFADAADKLRSSERSDLATTFRRFSTERAQFAAELESMAAAYGDDIDESGSAAAAVHRGWMAVKDAISGSSPSGVLDAAEQGEDHAVAEYDKALEEDISADLRATVTRQRTAVKAAHDEVRGLRDAVS
jgi:uncharacterized protein (TIGR02284 family)